MPGLLGERQNAVVVAVRTVRVVQVVVDHVVHVVAVRNGLVPTVGTMDVFGRVSATRVIGRAVLRVRGVHGEHVFVDMRLVGVVQVPIVEIVDVPVVNDGSVAAIRPVGVLVVVVNPMLVHV